MNIIIGISHPKHVYIFKNLIIRLKGASHNVIVLVSDKEMACELLGKFGITYFKIGANQKTLIKKILQLIKYLFVTLYYAIKYNVNLFIGFGYLHFGIDSFIMKKHFIFLEDTEVAEKIHKVLMPFTSSFLTTKAFKKTISSKQIRLNANLELAYLHSTYNNFQKENIVEPYVLLRFVSWEAFHDVGHHGLSMHAKETLVDLLSKKVKVYIASEGKLPERFKKYALNIDPVDIHQFVYGARLVIGESPTMTTESAMLGTPAICISSWACNSLGNLEELREYNLIYCYHPNNEKLAINKAMDIIVNDDIKKIWQNKAKKFINDRIDLTSFLFWFIENYPESHKIMKENPEYQNRFI